MNTLQLGESGAASTNLVNVMYRPFGDQVMEPSPIVFSASGGHVSQKFGAPLRIPCEIAFHSTILAHGLWHNPQR